MSYTLWDSVGGHRGMVLAFFAALLLGGACTKSNLVQGRCNKSSDCANGLVCDNLETCVPATASSAPCSLDPQCGSGYSCDDLGWCVCGNRGATGGNVCANGSSVIYRGVETDGGMPDGAGGSAGSGGKDASHDVGVDSGFVCHANNQCPTGKGKCADGGVCVECTGDGDCTTPTSPICDNTTNTCVPCTTDAQCVAKLGSTGNPGVCLFQSDGHCAIDSETVYVQPTFSGCLQATTTNGGSSTSPFCQLTPAIASAGIRSLFVIRGDGLNNATVQSSQSLSIIGQSATLRALSGSPGIHVIGTNVYIRDLLISGGMGTDIGLVVDTGGYLHMDTVTVDSMAQGGIFIDSTTAGFDIENTTVTNNGPGKQGTTTWGGFLISSLPDGGSSSLNRVTVQSNKWTGIICAGPVSSMGVLASSNTSGDIVPACGIVSCMTAGPTCGAPQ